MVTKSHSCGQKPSPPLWAGFKPFVHKINQNEWILLAVLYILLACKRGNKTTRKHTVIYITNSGSEFTCLAVDNNSKPKVKILLCATWTFPPGKLQRAFAIPSRIRDSEAGQEEMLQKMTLEEGRCPSPLSRRIAFCLDPSRPPQPWEKQSAPSTLEFTPAFQQLGLQGAGTQLGPGS